MYPPLQANSGTKEATGSGTIKIYETDRKMKEIGVQDFTKPCGENENDKVASIEVP